MDYKEDITELSTEFENSHKTLFALNDEIRRSILFELMKYKNRDGLCPSGIARMTNISRATVTYHLNILKDAGLICVKRTGKQCIYYIDPKLTALHKLTEALEHLTFTICLNNNTIYDDEEEVYG